MLQFMRVVALTRVRLDLNGDSLLSFKEFLRPIAGDGMHMHMRVCIREHSYSHLHTTRFIPLTLLSQFLSVKNEKSAKEAAQKPPAEPEMKEIDHAAVADKAMELFDHNSDGLVDPVEFFEVVKRANSNGKTVRCMAAAPTAATHPCNLTHAFLVHATPAISLTPSLGTG